MNRKVLIIEDEPSVADNIAYALGTDGFDTVWRSTGRDGLAALSSGCVDLIILDVGLPDRDGFEICREIRRQTDVPIIFLTARADEIDRVVGLEIGADDYIVKPFSPRELVARVKAILRRGRDRPSAPDNAVAAFAVDPDRGAIFYHGTRLDLTRYELKLLEILINRPGRIYSRDELMQLAWDDPDASTERTVDSHIKSIRAKLREVRSQTEPILTHRGLGYSLKEDS